MKNMKELKKERIKEMIEERIQVDQNGCWIWVGSKFTNGYGRLKVDGKTHRIHRLCYIIHRGEFDPELFVCHKCDVKLCVNPNHMFLGTAEDNAQDRAKKGRSCKGDDHWTRKDKEKLNACLSFGEKHPSTVLSDADLEQVFVLRKQGLSQHKIGDLLGVSQSQIGRILRGERCSRRNIKRS